MVKLDRVIDRLLANGKVELPRTIKSREIVELVSRLNKMGRKVRLYKNVEIVKTDRGYYMFETLIMELIED